MPPFLTSQKAADSYANVWNEHFIKLRRGRGSMIMKQERFDLVKMSLIMLSRKQEENCMFKKTLKVVVIFFAVSFLLEFMPYSFDVMAAEILPQQNTYQTSIGKGLDQSLGVEVLRGDLWIKMMPDEKVAFIWGFGHVVAIEQFLMEKYPELQRDSFVAKVIEGMANTPMSEVVIRVDNYYETSPNDIDKPVTSVLWDTMIRPNIKTGIAGQPLKNRQ
jgi:hypothetical protein